MKELLEYLNYFIFDPIVCIVKRPKQTGEFSIVEQVKYEYFGEVTNYFVAAKYSDSKWRWVRNSKGWNHGYLHACFGSRRTAEQFIDHLKAKWLRENSSDVVVG